MFILLSKFSSQKKKKKKLNRHIEGLLDEPILPIIALT